MEMLKYPANPTHNPRDESDAIVLSATMGLISMMFVVAAANALQNQQQRQQQQVPPPPPEPTTLQQRRQTAPPQPPHLGTFLAQQFVEGFREGYNLTSGTPTQARSAHTSNSSPFSSPQSYTNPYTNLYGEQLRQQTAAQEAIRREQGARAHAELLTQIEELRRQTEEMTARIVRQQMRARQSQAEEARRAAAAAAAEAEAEQARRQAEEEYEEWEAEQARMRAEEARREQEERRQRDAREEAKRRQRSNAAFAAADAARKKRQWETYQVAWVAFETVLNSGSRLKGPKDIIPWPTVGGKCPAVLDEESVKAFFLECASCWEQGRLSQMYKAEQVRWHPDKMRQKLKRSGREWEVVEREVTVVCQVVNGLVAA